ncbi:ABC transporter substrate-binding protein [Paenibacillus eucommiae]|uniref:Iron complex transport system substrate-binding protein n=1 Tax=Paenibacillus eucommiae TaxID=1355755 RepID=A0ABS4J1K2_9BACL|nr:ABC transporter substrate-binding protein [Paenibacillus eucommiae]MBP1993011.1 iron complex transport system substrate-binding protein [Paenibacillus eucommiae]
MSRRFILLFGTALLAIILVACSNSSDKKQATSTEDPEKPATRVVKDIFGDVTIPANPKNILVSNSSYAEYLIEMGVTPQLVLVVPEIEPDYRAPYLQEHGVEMIENAQYEYNYEQLLGLSPDLIIASGRGMETKVYEELSKVAPTIALTSGIGMHDAMPKLAELFDKKEQSEKVLAEFDQKAKAAKEKIHQAIGDKTVLVLRVEPKRYRYLGAKADDDVSRFFYETLGLKIPEIFKDTTEWFTPFSLEILPDIKADYIFVEKRSMENYDSSESLKELEENPLWKGLDAVKNNHVFPLRTNDYISAKGPIGTSLLIDYIVEKLVP